MVQLATCELGLSGFAFCLDQTRGPMGMKKKVIIER
jgi:hypothetical protein